MPFPYVETAARELRPALVITTRLVGAAPGLFWALMVTGAGNRGWDGDFVVPDFAACGLPIPCVVRTAKVAVFELRLATRLGRIDSATLALIDDALARQLLPDSISPPPGPRPR